MDKRGFLKSILAASIAPYVIATAGVLMPVRKLALADYAEGIWTPNILDDYEEGYDYTVGATYTRVGNIVLVRGALLRLDISDSPRRL